MFCPNCQTQNPDGVGFCGRCGTPLTAPAAPAAPAYGQPAPAPVSPAMAAVKKLCASPMVLIAAILFTVNFFLGLVNVITQSDELGYAYAAILYEMGLSGTGLADMLRDVVDLIIPIYLIGSIPTIFVLIGLWITYTGNLNRQSPLGSTGGLGLIKAGMIIEMIVMCLVMGLASIGTIGGGIALTDSYYSRDEAPYLIGMGFGFLLVLVFAIVYYVLILKSLTAAKVTLKTGKVVKRASAFVGVMCFITAAFNALSLLMNMEDMGALNLVVSLCSVTAAVLFGILIFSYRSKTAPFVVVYAQPAYAQPMYQQPVYQPPYQQPVYQQPTYAQPTQPVYQPPVAQPAYQPAPQPVAVAAPVAEPVMAAAPVAAPVVEPVVEPVMEDAPVAAPVVEIAPVEEPAVEPVAEPVVEVAPVEEPVVEVAPVVEPAVEPVVEAAPVVEPVVEATPVVEAAPVVEPTPAQPVAAPARVFCTQCGQPLTTDQRFCPHCGTPRQ